MNEAELKEVLKTLYKQLNILREREAKFGGDAPLSLLSQIEDHQTAITLVESRLADQITAEQLKEQLAPLNLSLDQGGTEIIIAEGETERFLQRLMTITPWLVLLLLVVGGAAYLAWRYFVPSQMPQDGSFNVAVAQIGRRDAAGQIHPSEDGQQLSQWIFNGLQEEYKRLPPEIKVAVWHDSMGMLTKQVTIGQVSNEDEARDLAQKIRANLIVYGTLDSNENVANFTPKFYINATDLPGASGKSIETGEIDEIRGSYQLGAPIAMQLPLDASDQLVIASIQPEVSLRAKALRWFTIGFIKDMAGQTKEAWEIFQQAEQELKGWGEKEKGKEILYYFIGREALFLSRDEAQAQQVFKSADEGRESAERYFNQALASNPTYARAFIGLGGVYYQRAKQASSDEQRLAALDQARDEYIKAGDNASKTVGDTIILDTKIGLAVVYQLKGDTYLNLGENSWDEADRYLQLAIDTAEETLPALAAKQQQRTLVHAYLLQGAAYYQQAYIKARQGNKIGGLDLYQKAEAAYTQCVAQGDPEKGGNPYDKLLQNLIENYCKPLRDEVTKARVALEGA